MSSACYVYGIVPAGTEVDADTAASGLGGGVEVLPQQRVAAVVDTVDPDRPFGTRKDLLSHSAVLDGLARTGPVVPLRFGSVLTDRESARQDLLVDQEEAFAELLSSLEGVAQYTLRARYEFDVVLAEVIEENAEVAQLREQTRAVSEESGHFERVRLGELVARAVQDKRDHDTQELVDAFAPFARDMVLREVSGMEELAELALLVDTDRQADFEEAAESLAAELYGRARLSLLGPMAAYDFVPTE